MLVFAYVLATVWYLLVGFFLALGYDHVLEGGDLPGSWFLAGMFFWPVFIVFFIVRGLVSGGRKKQT